MSQQTDNTNAEQLECPICFDTIEKNTNCVTTECGHTFHCSCLMKNTATNGFGCPMCRQVMAEVLDDDDSINSDSTWADLDNDTQNPDDNALTSFRMFQQQLENEEVEEDVEPEADEAEDEDDEETLPNPAYLATKLAEKGVTMEDMVKALLLEHEEYEDNFEVFDRRASEMYGELRRIILNYRV